MNKPKYIYFNKTESFQASIFKDAVTFIMLASLIYISNGSVFWTMVTGFMLISYIIASISNAKSMGSTFQTKKELQEFVDALPDDDN